MSFIHYSVCRTVCKLRDDARKLARLMSTIQKPPTPPRFLQPGYALLDEKLRSVAWLRNFISSRNLSGNEMENDRVKNFQQVACTPTESAQRHSDSPYYSPLPLHWSFLKIGLAGILANFDLRRGVWFYWDVVAGVLGKRLHWNLSLLKECVA